VGGNAVRLPATRRAFRVGSGIELFRSDIDIIRPDHSSRVAVDYGLLEVVKCPLEQRKLRRGR
jgi:hypothetical protein